jgi:hypothetical protein
MEARGQSISTCSCGSSCGGACGSGGGAHECSCSQCSRRGGLAYVTEAEYEDGFDRQGWDAESGQTLDADDFDDADDGFDDGDDFDDAGDDFDDAEDDFDDAGDDFDDELDVAADEFDDDTEEFDDDTEEFDDDTEEFDDDTEEFDDDDGPERRRPGGKPLPKPVPDPGGGEKPLPKPPSDPGGGEKPSGGKPLPPDPNTPKPTEKPVSDPELPTSGRFRTFESGVGACTGSRFKMLKRAFSEAHFVVRQALKDLDSLSEASDAERRWAWNATTEYHPEWTTLGYWFGEEIGHDPQGLENTLGYIHEMIARWELAFRKGFYYNGNGVFFRCKESDCLGDPPARHLTRNTIELCPPFFDDPPENDVERRRIENEERLITVVHEMGHWLLGSATRPRDERRSFVCSGGWNIAQNMCYRDKISRAADRYFKGGNPRALAMAGFNERHVALNNIDNYVCWMWNRAYVRYVNPGQTYK